MAQILKLRRGHISLLKNVTARKGELLMATGSIGSMGGPWLFMGESEGLTGAYRPISKIYIGTTTPVITTEGYGTTLDGTPFYSVTNKTLYALNSAGNQNLDLTGNLESRSITNLTITNLTSSNAVFTGNLITDGNITGSNLYLSGDAIIGGNLTLSGSIKIGDHTGDVVTILSEVSSSIIPDVDTAFNLGSGDKKWNDIYAGGTSYLSKVNSDEIIINTSLASNGKTTLGNQITDITSITGSLNVSGSSSFNGQAQFSSINVTDLTQNRIVIAGLNGELSDNNNLKFDGNKVQIGQGNLEIDNNGNIKTSGSIDVKTDLSVNGTTTLYGNLMVSGNVAFLGGANNVIISSSTIEIDDNIIRLNAYSPFERYAGFEVVDSGSLNTSASLLWDSLRDYWMIVSSSGESSKIIGVTPNTYGNELSLTAGAIPIATGAQTIGDSLLTITGTTMALNVNKFTIDVNSGNTLVAGNLTMTSIGGLDGGSKTSVVTFKNSNNVMGYVSTTETYDEMDGILGYRHSDGKLVFSMIIDGGEYTAP